MRIRVGNNDLDVGDISINLKFTNPLFSDKIFSDGYSLGFDLDITPNNASILFNADRLDDRIIGTEHNVTVYAEGVLMFNAVMTVKSINRNKINCFLNSVGLATAKKLERINLRDLNLEKHDVCEDSDTPEDRWDKWANRLQAQWQLVINKRPFDQITHYFPPIHAPLAYDGENNWWCNMINHYWHAESLQFLKHKVKSDVYSEKPGWGTTLSPCPNFVYVFKKALEKVGITLDENYLMALDEIQNMFIFSNEVMDDIYQYAGNYQNTFGFSYHLADFLPDMKAIALPLALKQLFGAVIYEQDNRMRVVSSNDLIKQSSEDWTKYVNSTFQKKLDQTNNHKVEWTLNDDSYTTIYEDQFEAYEINVEALETVTSQIKVARPLATRPNPNGTIWGAELADNIYRVTLEDEPNEDFYENPPSLGHNAPVRSIESDQSPDDIIEQLLLGVYRGHDIEVPDYPSFVNQSEVDGSNYGEFALLLNGDDGLGENWLKELINYINGGSPIEVALSLPIHKVAELARFHKIKKAFYFDKGRVEGIIKEFSFSISNKGISPVKAQFIINNQ